MKAPRHRGTKASCRLAPGSARGGKGTRHPFGESAIAHHASADPQMHAWRDWKRRMTRWESRVERHRYDVRLSGASRDAECLLRNQRRSSALSISGIYMCIFHAAAFMHRTTNRTMASFISRITMWRSNRDVESRLFRAAQAGLFTITFRSTSATCHQ